MSAREKKRPTGAVVGGGVGIGVTFDLLLGLAVIPTEALRFFAAQTRDLSSISGVSHTSARVALARPSRTKRIVMRQNRRRMLPRKKLMHRLAAHRNLPRVLENRF